jgi:hypothetical protein
MVHERENQMAVEIPAQRVGEVVRRHVSLVSPKEETEERERGGEGEGEGESAKVRRDHEGRDWNLTGTWLDFSVMRKR